MPLYEYHCRGCEAQFELLLRGDDSPVCPTCGGVDLERRLSLPRVRSSSTRAQAMKAAKARDRKQGADRTRERVEYEANHD